MKEANPTKGGKIQPHGLCIWIISSSYEFFIEIKSIFYEIEILPYDNDDKDNQQDMCTPHARNENTQYALSDIISSNLLWKFSALWLAWGVFGLNWYSSMITIERRRRSSLTCPSLSKIIYKIWGNKMKIGENMKCP